MKFLILFISINKLLSVPIDQFQIPQVNHKIESYNNLEKYKQQQAYNTFYQILKTILKNPSMQIEITFDNNSIIYEEDNIKYINPT